MTRSLTSCWIAGAVLIAGTTAHAQDARRVTIAAGVATFQQQPPGDEPATTYDTGWVITGTYVIVRDRLSAVADVSGNSRTNVVGERQDVKAYLFGVRYEVVAGRITMFGQGLFGRETFTEPGFSEHGFAFQPGGGADFLVWKGLGARGAVDYRVTNFDGATFTAWRIVAGGVVSLSW